jgi:hypothetical protein
VYAYHDVVRLTHFVASAADSPASMIYDKSTKLVSSYRDRGHPGLRSEPQVR